MPSVPTTPLELGTHVFDHADQQRFAALSGDVNPMHMDPLASRRLLTGRQVVHGVHTLLILLDRWIEQTGQPIGALRCDFDEAICVGDRVQFGSRHTEGQSVLVASVEGLECTKVILRSERPRATGTRLQPLGPLPVQVPLDRDPASWVRHPHAIPLAASGSAAAFPSACDTLGEQPVRALMALSYLVGMVCPGLNSIFSSVDVGFDPKAGETIEFEVDRYDSRFRLMTISLRGALCGTLKAFVRPPPQAQAKTRDLLAAVAPNEFAGTRSLIIGGSRGLGEFTAKLTAAGGGDVLVTYAYGEADAREVADDINSVDRGSCRIAPYRLGQPFGGLLGAGAVPTAVYYYATPRIYRKRSSLFDRAVFDEFVETYVVHFLGLCTWLESLGTEPPVRVYFPSTVFVDDRPRGMTEYAMAKSAGEQLVSDLTATLQHVEIFASRLPRLATDQTSSVMTVKTASNLEVLLPIVRRMLARRAGLSA